MTVFFLVGRNVSLFVVLGFLFNICPGTVLLNSLFYFSDIQKYITHTCRRPKRYKIMILGLEFFPCLYKFQLYTWLYSLKTTMKCWCHQWLLLLFPSLHTVPLKRVSFRETKVSSCKARRDRRDCRLSWEW